MNLPSDDLGILCICAERYAIGRCTYMPGLVCGIIQNNLDELSDRDINVMIQDISNPICGYGDECDKTTWINMLTKLVNERERRNLRNAD